MAEAFGRILADVASKASARCSLAAPSFTFHMFRERVDGVGPSAQEQACQLPGYLEQVGNRSLRARQHGTNNTPLRHPYCYRHSSRSRPTAAPPLRSLAHQRPFWRSVSAPPAAPWTSSKTPSSSATTGATATLTALRSPCAWGSAATNSTRPTAAPAATPAAMPLRAPRRLRPLRVRATAGCRRRSRRAAGFGRRPRA